VSILKKANFNYLTMGKTIIINEGGTAGSFNLLPFYWQGVFIL